MSAAVLKNSNNTTGECQVKLTAIDTDGSKQPFEGGPCSADVVEISLSVGVSIIKQLLRVVIKTRRNIFAGHNS